MLEFLRGLTSMQTGGFGRNEFGDLQRKEKLFLLQLIWENKSVNITEEIRENVVQPGIKNGFLDYRKYTLTTQPLNRLC